MGISGYFSIRKNVAVSFPPGMRIGTKKHLKANWGDDHESDPESQGEGHHDSNVKVCV
jgi:hypothetical protein